MALRPLAALNRLRSTYWFLPALVTLAAVGLAALMTSIDRSEIGGSWLGWVYSGGADGARALLSAVAGSTITVVSVTFSVLVVALTVSSQHFGPRLLNSFMRDTPAQLVLGMFTGTFAYCLLVLRTVQADGGDNSAFIPHVAVTVAVVLALASLGMLIYYVHHVSRSLQVSDITGRVAGDLEDAVERLYPEQFGEDSEPRSDEPPPVPAGAAAVTSARSAYVQEIDSDAALALARQHDTTIWLMVRPGDFVVEGMRLAAADPPPRDAERFARRLRGAYVFGTDRTSHQDAAFAVQQLVEVALRALSPGVNEPFTAINCIDRLTQGLAKLAARGMPSAVRADDEGRPRIVSRPRTFEELLQAAFEPIAVYADRNGAVSRRLLEVLDLLASLAHRPADRRAIVQMAEIVRHPHERALEG